MDSGQAVVATSGALQNITSYLNGTLVNLGSAFQGSNEYISETLGVPPSVVYSSLAALVAVPLTMSRYGWSRPSFSPYSSMSGGAPAVTDEDFSYITSQDLDDPNAGAYTRKPAREVPRELDDDVLIIKNKGVSYPAHFPAYTIGDGKLRVMDVKDRIGLMMDVSDRTARRIKLLYKGRQLKEPAAPVREYGVKNNSEIMAVVPEGADDSSPSEEEMVIVGDSEPRSSSGKSSRRNRKKKSKKSKSSGATADGDDTSAAPDSNSNMDGASSPTGQGSESMKQLDEIASEFRTKWLPLCAQYTKSPPTDAKKREDEHRRLSESVLQQTLLKLDGVETAGDPDVRATRKQLVQEVQTVLKELDVAKESG